MVETETDGDVLMEGGVAEGVGEDSVEGSVGAANVAADVGFERHRTLK